MTDKQSPDDDGPITADKRPEIGEMFFAPPGIWVLESAILTAPGKTPAGGRSGGSFMARV